MTARYHPIGLMAPGYLDDGHNRSREILIFTPVTRETTVGEAVYSLAYEAQTADVEGKENPPSPEELRRAVLDYYGGVLLNPPHERVKPDLEPDVDDVYVYGYIEW